MKLNAELNQENHSINIKQEGERVFAEIDDRTYEIDAHKIKEGVYLLKHDGRVFECHIDRNENKREQFNVEIKNQSFKVKLYDPKRFHARAGTDASADGIAEILAPMPGKIVRVLASVGDEIKSGDSVIVVEAMKMQNEMKSPKDGTVKEIRAQAGDTVNGGDVLAIIE